jgi:hypothetical protein
MTHSVVESPFWEAGSHSNGHENPFILWNPGSLPYSQEVNTSICPSRWDSTPDLYRVFLQD